MKTDNLATGYAFDDISQNLVGVFQQFGPYLFDKVNPLIILGQMTLGPSPAEQRRQGD